MNNSKSMKVLFLDLNIICHFIVKLADTRSAGQIRPLCAHVRFFQD